jgi:hypothetical protein
MTSSVEIEDLSQAVEPRAQIELQQARIAARRGVDVLVVTPVCWTVCSLCNLPAYAWGGMSICCYGPVRIQGWTR